MSAIPPAAGAVFPDHVPPELRWDHSLRDFALELDDPFMAVCRLHEGPDIFYARDISQERPGWVITRHALQNQAFLDHEHFSSKGNSGLDQMLGAGFRLIPIDCDPPEQTAYRMMINPLFTPRAVEALDAPVAATCDRLIAQFDDRDGCEFIEDFAIPFPSYIFLSLFGMPVEEAPQFLEWEAGLLRGRTIEERVAAARGVKDYLQGFIAQQRVRPTTELLKVILQAKSGDRPISDEELLGMLYTFYVGGLDTVSSTLGWIMRHLALDPELQQRLRANPDLIPRAIEEFARAYSVVSTVRRVAQDFTFHGVEMREGDLALMPLFLAGRDPRMWDSPHEIDLDRRGNALTFASGPHICVGRFLARRELRIALERILGRFENIRIRPGESYSYHTSPVYGVDRLALTWSRAAP